MEQYRYYRCLANVKTRYYTSLPTQSRRKDAGFQREAHEETSCRGKWINSIVVYMELWLSPFAVYSLMISLAASKRYG